MNYLFKEGGNAIMKINTKYHGEVEIEPNKIITFPQGLPGFVDEKKFIILDLQENAVFQVLQSIQTEDLGFVTIDPYHIYNDYAFDLDDYTIESLRIKSSEEVNVLAIVSLKKPFNKSTINLQAPIVINQANKYAKQYITNNTTHLIKAPIQPSDQKGEG